ncbi:hypothetical protein PS862_05020 [Pseudomonas fluorescens]|uniref:Resolvase/invertase-type recombinase catalytic domain-containing protein n=1 Tax=Pseudomonas fluorescens TaxID=294 RepID=A0A5E7P4I9_PSEFL|nr:recombinase family protein [Pseudomonas fluorescens]VVP43670.1 hypothetical protein PS862_05020 [Pseudomonas fluorescens]
MKIVSYIRVSGSPYDESALSLDTQREYIARAAEQNGWDIVSEFVDVAASKVAIGKRLEGAKALVMCKRLGAPLVVAKLDRLSRSAHHIAQLMKELEFKVATMSHATAYELHLYATLVEHERKFIYKGLRDAQPLPQQIVGLELHPSFLEEHPHYATFRIGRTSENRQLAAVAVSNRVKVFHSEVRPHIQACLDTGLTTLSDVANCLNGKGIKTSRGGLWSSTQVKRVMEALNLKL